MSRYAGTWVSGVFVFGETFALTTTVPANIVYAVELIGDFGNWGRNDTVIQSDQKHGKAKSKTENLKQCSTRDRMHQELPYEEQLEAMRVIRMFIVVCTIFQLLRAT